MPIKLQRIQSDLQGVTSGGLGNQQINLDGDVFGIMLDFRSGAAAGLTAAQIIADVTYVQVTADGRELFYMNARDLIAYNDFYFAGLAGIGATPTVFTAGQLYVPFDKPRYPFAAEQEAFGIGAADTKTLQVYVQFNAVVLVTARVGITTIQDSTIRPTAQHLRINNFQQNQTAVGILSVQNLPLDSDTAILAMHAVVPIAAVISQAAVYANNQEVRRINRLPSIDQQRRGGRVPQLPITNANTFDMFTIDFNETNDGTNYLRMQGVSQLRVELTFTGAAPNSFPFYLERVFGVPPISV